MTSRTLTWFCFFALGLAAHAGEMPGEKEKQLFAEVVRLTGSSAPTTWRAVGFRPARPEKPLLRLPAGFWNLDPRKAAEALLETHYGLRGAKAASFLVEKPAPPPESGSLIVVHRRLIDEPEDAPERSSTTSLITWTADSARVFATARQELGRVPGKPEGRFDLQRSRFLHLLRVTQCLRLPSPALPLPPPDGEPARVIVNQGPPVLEIRATGAGGWQIEVQGAVHEFELQSRADARKARSPLTLASLLWRDGLRACLEPAQVEQAGRALEKFEPHPTDSPEFGMTDQHEHQLAWLLDRFGPAWEQPPNLPTLWFARHIAQLLSIWPLADEGATLVRLQAVMEGSTEVPELATEKARLRSALELARHRRELAASTRNLLQAALALSESAREERWWADQYLSGLGEGRIDPVVPAFVEQQRRAAEGGDAFQKALYRDREEARRMLAQAVTERRPETAEWRLRLALASVMLDDADDAELIGHLRDRSLPAALRQAIIDLYVPKYGLRLRASAAFDRACPELVAEESAPEILTALLRALARRRPAGAFAAVLQRWEGRGFKTDKLQTAARLVLGSCIAEATEEQRRKLGRLWNLRQEAGVTAALLAGAWDVPADKKVLPIWRALAASPPPKRLLVAYALGANRLRWAYTDDEGDSQWLLQRWVAECWRALPPDSQAQVERFDRWLERTYFTVGFPFRPAGAAR